MNGPRVQRAAAHVRALIEEGRTLPALEGMSATSGRYFSGEARVQVQSWLVRVANALDTIFGERSSHCFHFKDYTKSGFKHIEHGHEILNIVGTLDGALRDLEGGFLIGQEFLLAAEVHDSLLMQAKNLCGLGYCQAAAVMARIVLEDTLRRICAAKGLNSLAGASALNDALKMEKIYSQAEWRRVQSWLDVGNAAAHGKTEDSELPSVERMIDDVSRFVAAQLA